MAALTRIQIEALKALLAMPPADREAALDMFAHPQSPHLSPQLQLTPQQQRPLRRRSSLGSAASFGSTSSHNSVLDDNNSVSSNSSQRVRHKIEAKTLAAYLCKQYFNGKSLWDYLYNSNNRIDSLRLNNCLDQIQATLSKDKQRTLEKQRETVVGHLKKKIAAGRNYRMSGKGKKNSRKLEAPMAHTIDLTKTDDSDNDKGADDSDKGADDSNSDKDADGGSNDKKTNKRQILAEKFKKKMQEIRESRQPAKKKKRKAPAKKKVTRRSSTRRRLNQQSDDDVVETTKKKKNKPSVVETAKKKNSPGLKVGSKISGKWNQDDKHKGEWYDGVVKSINTSKKTVHIVFDDGDEDDELKWTDLRILD